MSNVIKDRIFVILQIILFFVFTLNINLGNFEVFKIIQLFCIAFGTIGLLMIVIPIFQLRRAISPFPTPTKNATLITEGLFKYMRHPIYTGIILLFFSVGIYQGSVFKILISFLIFGLLYLKSVHEEKLLLKRFNKYHIYKDKTGRFFPKMK